MRNMEQTNRRIKWKKYMKPELVEKWHQKERQRERKEKKQNNKKNESDKRKGKK